MWVNVNINLHFFSMNNFHTYVVQTTCIYKVFFGGINILN